MTRQKKNLKNRQQRTLKNTNLLLKMIKKAKISRVRVPLINQLDGNKMIRLLCNFGGGGVGGENLQNTVLPRIFCSEAI
jgi:hypothetical protein